MYPTIITVASPIATKPTESQNGSPKNFHNSNPTMKELLTTGKIMAMPSLLQNMIHVHAIKVAKLPNPTSTIPIEDARFAIAHPSTNPMV